MTLVSSAKATGFDTEFFSGEGHFMNNTAPGTDPYEIPCFNTSQSEKKIRVKLGDFTSPFCLY